MRFILGLLSGLLGMLAGWSALAALVIMLAGPDRDGGIAMGAVFNIGPIGGIAGLIAGIWLFVRFGLVRSTALPSFPFAVTVLFIAAGLVVGLVRTDPLAQSQSRLHDA